MQSALDSVTQKIQFLSPEQLSEIEDLIATMKKDEDQAILALSEPSFAAVWNDPENDVYDAL